MELKDRFLKYVSYDTQSSEQSRTFPSTDKQLVLLRELADGGSAVFFSSHVLEVVEKLCNKVAIIKQGTLRACGPTADVVGDESLEDVFLDMIDRNA